jgi:hypothetical protein
LSREGVDVAITRGSSYENRANLAPEFFGQIIRKYEGTRIGRQELLGEVLTDTPGALWRHDQIEELRRTVAPPLRRIVIAIDPAGSAEGDETGIVAVGLGEDDHGYVLNDSSGQWQPTEWARHAVELYRTLKADRIVAETNFGGGMVEATIRMIDPNVAFTAVTASRGKVARAEPVSALYEQHRMHHVGSFPSLEDQMCSFTADFNRRIAGYSPGRVDALVWGASELLVAPMRRFAIFELYRREAAALQLQNDAPPPLSFERRRDEAIRAERARFGGADEWSGRDARGGAGTLQSHRRNHPRSRLCLLIRIAIWRVSSRPSGSRKSGKARTTYCPPPARPRSPGA